MKTFKYENNDDNKAFLQKVKPNEKLIQQHKDYINYFNEGSLFNGQIKTARKKRFESN